MATFCTGCGEKLDGTPLFCTGCGQKVDHDAAVAPPAPAAQSSPAAAQSGAQAGASVPAAPPAAASGNRKLALWFGVLLALIAVTAGLAYVAFQRFLDGSELASVAEVEEMAVEAEPPAIEEQPVQAPAAPAAEMEPEPQPLVVEAPPAAAPTPKPARTPAPRPEPAPAPAPEKRNPPPAPKPAVTQAAKATAPPPAPKPLASTQPVKPAQPPVSIARPAPPPAPKPANTASTAPPPTPKGSKVMLSGAEAFSPPPAPKVAKTAPAAVAAVRADPTSGDIFWAGTLDKNQIVTVDFASGAPAASGQALPGKPVKLETFSPVVEITELPGPENGWKRFSFKAKRNAKRSVTLNFHWSLSQ